MIRKMMYKFLFSGVKFGLNPIVEQNCLIMNRKRLDKGSQMTVIGDNCFIRSGSTIYPGNSIGNNFITGNKVNIRENNIIGDNVSIGTLSIIEHSTRIGNNVRIHSGAFIPEYTTIENEAWIGPRVVITNSKYPARKDSKDNLSGVHIARGAVIGANVTILPGLRIGRNALIGAGSVITKDIPDNMVYVGNPARPLANSKNES
tara:strand:+ start:193 stop:801 length:609 start_codon:yes stop_codon:yes gene_type:complete